MRQWSWLEMFGRDAGTAQWKCTMRSQRPEEGGTLTLLVKTDTLSLYVDDTMRVLTVETRTVVDYS